MKVALLGATGKAAARLIAELKLRGHEVTGIARKAPDVDPGVPLLLADANDAAALADAISGHDALIVAARFVSIDAATILDALQRAGVPRILVVGGAGTLEAAPGTLVIDLPTIPEAFLPEMRGGQAFLAALKASDADWTFLSPAANFGPGERTGRYRLGGDALMRDANGDSRISYEDLAWAMVDELEEPQHRRQRFSIAY
jgi:putative NADH-flavin reductase